MNHFNQSEQNMVCPGPIRAEKTVADSHDYSYHPSPGLCWVEDINREKLCCFDNIKTFRDK